MEKKHSKEATVEVFFFAMSVHKIQSKYQNTTFLLVHIQIWIDFETTKNMTFKLNSSLFILTQKYTAIHMYVEYGH